VQPAAAFTSASPRRLEYCNTYVALLILIPIVYFDRRSRAQSDALYADRLNADVLPIIREAQKARLRP
jgi:hypothetical protein